MPQYWSHIGDESADWPRMISPAGDGLLWLLACCALVMVMQAGFLCLESGLTRSKNNINVAMKNLADLGLSMVMFWAFGFGLMFGISKWGWFGTSAFAQDLASVGNAVPVVFFLFQALFCGTAVTIMSGAVAERMRFKGYLALAAVVTGLVYPLLGHWIWNTNGWLHDLGFSDFAGATVVHSTGGWAALAVILVLGPRAGRFEDDASPKLSASNLPFATLGALLLWCGWVGFNGGSLFAFDERVVGIVANTALGGGAGLLTALLVGWKVYSVPRVTDSITGLLAGLVAVTASAQAVSSRAAVAIAVVGALVALLVDWLLIRRKIDDVVGVVPVHLGAGVWGTVAVALFADQDVLDTGLSRSSQLGVQVLGLGIAAVWVFGVIYVVAKILDRVWGLRVSEHDEEVGLNVAEHGASSELYELVSTMHRHAATGDLKTAVPESPFSEVGQIGRQYNMVIDALVASQAALGVTQTAAERDELSGVLNRRGVHAVLNEHAGSPVTALMFDVVGFGSINASLGYTAGDEVIVQVTQNLAERLGPNWAFGRWGGDEFIAIGPAQAQVGPEIIERVVCTLGSGGKVAISVRVGVVHGVASSGSNAIVRQAGYSLDEAKRSDQAIVYFDDALQQRFHRSQEIAALAPHDLAHRVQPFAQTMVSDGQIVGVELLARWRDPDLALTSPAEFLPMLVENGRLHELDFHMVHEGVTFASRLQRSSLDVWVTINVSAPTLTMTQFVSHVESQLDRSGLSPERLIIEITETERVETADRWVSHAHQLRELGVGLAIDDFGSGYSGLQRIKTLPITHIKFDRELVRTIDGSLDGVIGSVAQYARDCGIVSVAEGIETAAEEQQALRYGIDVMQGFLFSRPAPLDVVADAISSQQLELRG